MYNTLVATLKLDLEPQKLDCKRPECIKGFGQYVCHAQFVQLRTSPHHKEMRTSSFGAGGDGKGVDAVIMNNISKVIGPMWAQPHLSLGPSAPRSNRPQGVEKGLDPNGSPRAAAKSILSTPDLQEHPGV